MITVINGNVITPIRYVYSARLGQSLSGECTLTVTGDDELLGAVGDSSQLVCDGLRFNVISYTTETDGQVPICTVECEHVSYMLSDDIYKIQAFSRTGTPYQLLSAALAGTPFTVGTAPTSGEYTIVLNKISSRRSLINTIAAMVGCEISYGNDCTINLSEHIGGTEYALLPNGAEVTGVGMSRSVLEGITSYNISLGRKGDLSLGDNVHIVYYPLGINAETRIISIEYNPYNHSEVSIEVGSFVPDIVDSYVANEKAAQDYVKQDDLQEYAKKSEVTSELAASVTEYINTAEGQASIVQSLTGTFVTQSDLSGYAQKTELAAEIGTYIDTQAGTAKIINRLTGTFTKPADLNGYTKKTELAAEIGSYIDTTAGTAKIVTRLTGTFAKTSDLSGYTQKTELAAEIGAYIDTTAGTAKIISSVSGTYQKKSDMSGYATTTAVSEIEQSIDDVESKITLSTTYSNNTIGTNVKALLQLVSNPNSSNIKIKADKIEMTGTVYFLQASDLSSSGTTQIDAGRITTGTIGADRIDVNALKVGTIYGAGTYSNTVLLSSNGLQLYVGGSAFTSTGIKCTDVYLAASGSIYLGSNTWNIKVTPNTNTIAPSSTGNGSLGSTSAVWKTAYFGGASGTPYIVGENPAVLRPSTKSDTSTYNLLGTTTYPWNSVVSKEFTAYSTSIIGIKMTASSTGCTLAPTGTTTSRPTSSLGTSTVYWYNCYLGENNLYLGKTANSKIGFFGTTPAARQTVSNTATVATLITALKKYGLIA